MFQINQAAKMDQPVRFNWANWHMRKDYLRRKCLAEHAPDRLRYVALKKNDILPVEIQVSFFSSSNNTYFVNDRLLRTIKYPIGYFLC